MLFETLTYLICCFTQADFDTQIKNLPKEAYDIKIIPGCPLSDGYTSIHYKVKTPVLAE